MEFKGIRCVALPEPHAIFDKRIVVKLNKSEKGLRTCDCVRDCDIKMMCDAKANFQESGV